MTHLVVLGLDSPAKAEEVFDLAGDLAKQELLQLQDAAYAYRDDRGKVRIHQSAASSNRARRCSCSPARPPSTR
jgi:uncharacterized membrane protein